MKSIIFLRVTWMKRYRGLKSDTPSGGGTYIDKHEDGGEVYNFLNVAGKAYGYTRPRTIDIRRIGAFSNDNKIDGVTVVWFAKHPILNGQFIVGWYKNATVYREQNSKIFSNRKNYSEFNVEAKFNDCTLIPEEERVFELFNPQPGRNFVWFGHEKMNKVKLGKIWDYINTGKLPIPQKNKGGNAYRSFQIDVEKRKKVEEKAIKTAIHYFEENEYFVKNVDRENKGWDLEATKNGRVINIEVKGLSGNILSVELTANEYSQFQKKSKNYYLFVVTNALSENVKSRIFTFKDGRCVDSEYNELEIKVNMSATLFLP